MNRVLKTSSEAVKKDGRSDGRIRGLSGERHFLSSACQFVITVRGGTVAASPPAGTFTRNRWPSREGA
jgi:hypothetical protein